MLQIYTTQLCGTFKNVMKNNEEVFENCARALAQACISEGSIYIHGIKEMISLIHLTTSNNLLKRVQPLFQNGDLAELQQCDRVILFTPSIIDNETTTLIESIRATNALLIIICAEKKSKMNANIDEHFTLFLQAKAPLVPLDNGKKIGVPAIICANYAYECLYLLTTEILSEYEEEPSL